MKNLVFYSGFGTFCAHELDAVLNHEWRVIPGIRALPEDIGVIVFVAAHIPIFAVLAIMISSHNFKIRHLSRFVVAVFLIFHACLHILFKTNPEYEFTHLFSNILIYGGAMLGIIYLLLDWRDRSGLGK